MNENLHGSQEQAATDVAPKILVLGGTNNGALLPLSSAHVTLEDGVTYVRLPSKGLKKGEGVAFERYRVLVITLDGQNMLFACTDQKTSDMLYRMRAYFVVMSRRLTSQSKRRKSDDVWRVLNHEELANHEWEDKQ